MGLTAKVIYALGFPSGEISPAICPLEAREVVDPDGLCLTERLGFVSKVLLEGRCEKSHTLSQYGCTGTRALPKRVFQKRTQWSPQPTSCGGDLLYSWHGSSPFTLAFLAASAATLTASGCLSPAGGAARSLCSSEEKRTFRKKRDLS